jgi:hypothetical protein
MHDASAIEVMEVPESCDMALSFIGISAHRADLNNPWVPSLQMITLQRDDHQLNGLKRHKLIQERNCESLSNEPM